jgi:exonuclease VII small subunit
MELEQLIAHLEVQTNILNEKRAEIEKYERGVRAMREADTVARV